MDIYKKIYGTIKAAFPDISIGGPGIELWEDSPRLDKILANLSQESMLPDFITVHKTGIPAKTPDISNAFMHECRAVLRCLKKYRLHKQLWLTHYGPRSGQNNAANDSDFSGHFICRMLMAGQPLKTMGYGALSDISEENRGDPGNIFTGEGGLITWNGLFKSGYYVLDFFRQLGPWPLLQDSHHLIARSDAPSSLQILTFCEEQERFEEITLENMPQGTYKIKQMTINQLEGNIYEHWKRFGSPKEPSLQELEMLERMAHPKYCVSIMETEHRHTLTLSIDVKPWEIQLLLIEKIQEG